MEVGRISIYRGSVTVGGGRRDFCTRVYTLKEKFSSVISWSINQKTKNTYASSVRRFCQDCLHFGRLSRTGSTENPSPGEHILLWVLRYCHYPILRMFRGTGRLIPRQRRPFIRSDHFRIRGRNLRHGEYPQPYIASNLLRKSTKITNNKFFLPPPILSVLRTH